MNDPDYEFSEAVGLEKLTTEFNQNTMFTRHNIFMFGLIALSFIIAGLQAIHGMTTFDSFLDVIVPILIGVEHTYGGNTRN